MTVTNSWSPSSGLFPTIHLQANVTLTTRIEIGRYNDAAKSLNEGIKYLQPIENKAWSIQVLLEVATVATITGIALCALGISTANPLAIIIGASLLGGVATTLIVHQLYNFTMAEINPTHHFLLDARKEIEEPETCMKTLFQENPKLLNTIAETLKTPIDTPMQGQCLALIAQYHREMEKVTFLTNWLKMHSIPIDTSETEDQEESSSANAGGLNSPTHPDSQGLLIHIDADAEEERNNQSQRSSTSTNGAHGLTLASGFPRDEDD